MLIRASDSSQEAGCRPLRDTQRRVFRAVRVHATHFGRKARVELERPGSTRTYIVRVGDHLEGRQGSERMVIDTASCHTQPCARARMRSKEHELWVVYLVPSVLMNTNWQARRLRAGTVSRKLHAVSTHRYRPTVRFDVDRGRLAAAKLLQCGQERVTAPLQCETQTVCTRLDA